MYYALLLGTVDIGCVTNIFRLNNISNIFDECKHSGLSYDLRINLCQFTI